MIVVKAHGPQRVPLTAAGGGEHLQTPVPGQLHRRHAHPTGGGVHQHSLPGLHLGQGGQRVIGRRENDRGRGGVGVGPTRRNLDHQPLVGDRDGAGAFREQAGYPVAHRETAIAQKRFRQRCRTPQHPWLHPHRDRDLARS